MEVEPRRVQVGSEALACLCCADQGGRVAPGHPPSLNVSEFLWVPVSQEAGYCGMLVWGVLMQAMLTNDPNLEPPPPHTALAWGRKKATKIQLKQVKKKKKQLAFQG